MDYRGLHLVTEVCRHGGFGRAARALGVSQPALSKAIARLEDQLGVVLFSRGGGSTLPTIFALHIEAYARERLGDADRITAEVRQMAIDETGRVRIADEPAARTGFMPRLVRAIVERFPRLKLELVNLAAADIGERLMARAVDLGVTSRPLDLSHPELTAFPLLTSPLVAVGRPGHPLLADDAPAPQGYAVALPSLSPELGRLAGRAEGDGGADVIGPDFDLVKEIVAGTDVISHGPAFLFDDELAAGRLASIPATLEGGPYALRLFATDSALLSPVIRRIAAMAQACGAEIVGLERLPPKWEPVWRSGGAQTQRLEPSCPGQVDST
ncbi:MAG TPA: LysR family transcriptional regulator [Caulobacteraceae bacterium]|nr:LysR family transcriptional regulator [Caulobacteraceae bacterium]